MTHDRRHFLKMLGQTALVLPFVTVDTAFAATKDLNAEFKPSKPKPNPQPEAEPSSPVMVGLSPVGSSVLKMGSVIRFRVSSNHTGYGHLYITNASGNVVLIAENLRIKGGRPIDLPRDGVVLRAAPPIGDNDVLFLATRDRFSGFAGGKTTTTPTDLQVSGEGFLATLKSSLAEIPRDRWGYTDVIVRVTE